jgi:hypothetical protein
MLIEGRHGRSRLLIFAALPAVCFLWFIGWSLYYIGEKRVQK